MLDEALNKAPFYTQFVQVMGGMPEDLEDPTLGQLAAMVKKVKTLRQPPYADFAIWLPLRQEALEDAKVQVLRDDSRRPLHHEDGAGTCRFSTLAVELQGPANHVGDDGYRWGWQT